jgi:hypothetical protein
MYISSREDLESIIQDEFYQDLIVEVMETLSMFIHEKEFYNLISADMQRIGVNIGLTLLRTSKSELEIMKNDPDNFVQLALDTCDK